MPSIIPGYEYDIFISYRQKDNKTGWVTEFVENLRNEIEATFKEDISIYFDSNPHDGLHENHDVDSSLKEKIKCLVFIPIVSQTYCDINSFAWQNEFLPFIDFASNDQFGLDVKVANGNVAKRVLPLEIHEIDGVDKVLFQEQIGSVMRPIEFVYKEPGVNRPLATEDSELKNLNETMYTNQINKLANAIKEIIHAMKSGFGETKHYSQTKPKEENNASSQGNRQKKNLWLTLIMASLLVLLVLYFLIPSSENQEAVIEEEKSIAVLPFKDLTAGSKMEHFAHGLTEEISNALLRVPDFKVAYSRAIADNNFEIQSAATEMGVAYILTGSVRSSDERLRITPQLIRASDGFQIWSESYDRTLKDAIAIQEDIAWNVAIVLRTAMDPEAVREMVKVGTKSIDAFQFYLEGLTLSGISSYKKFELARNTDTLFAEAHFRAAIYWNFS